MHAWGMWIVAVGIVGGTGLAVLNEQNGSLLGALVIWMAGFAGIRSCGEASIWASFGWLTCILCCVLVGLLAKLIRRIPVRLLLSRTRWSRIIHTHEDTLDAKVRHNGLNRTSTSRTGGSCTACSNIPR